MDQHVAKDQLTELNLKLGDAEKHKHIGFFEAVLADDVRFRRASGAISDKQTFLADLANPRDSTECLESKNIEVSVAGSTAVVSLIVHMSGMRGGNAVKGDFRNIRVFRHEAESWKLTMWINTRIESTL